ncbi:hypothetical protein PRIPAC_83642 [Pristionchus pacificus]|uniref:Uncharacterized protein n=1 Tax=Pristionchus pacificus TaxID=54126 RepID=A0A2A6CEI3_PRIPA|nr:hypothetical protein PRIPAC_83642 [Pristionchus pacificus]|eukprot:PDM76604.1 hypothetical protein PRIPAC_42970 [Pristionchus pacificus]
MASLSARQEKRPSLSALDPPPPLSPIAEEGALRKMSSLRRSSKKKMSRANTLDSAALARVEKIPRPRNLSFDLPTDDSDPGVNSASSSSAASTCSDRSYGSCA